MGGEVTVDVVMASLLIVVAAAATSSRMPPSSAPPPFVGGGSLTPTVPFATANATIGHPPQEVAKPRWPRGELLRVMTMAVMAMTSGVTMAVVGSDATTMEMR